MSNECYFLRYACELQSPNVVGMIHFVHCSQSVVDIFLLIMTISTHILLVVRFTLGTANNCIWLKYSVFISFYPYHQQMKRLDPEPLSVAADRFVQFIPFSNIFNGGNV